MDTHLAFAINRASIQNRILIPKFYDPDLIKALDLVPSIYSLYNLSDLLLPGEQGSRLGDWIRREWYGSGVIPFVRTSDLSHWRIRPDYKKGVSEEIYTSIRQKQDIEPNDILMVAHGTYLVGEVAIVTENEKHLVLQDHVFRLRVNPAMPITPFYLLAALSTSFVKRQIRARQFSADIIDKIGERHLTIQIPVPRSSEILHQISTQVSNIISDQSLARSFIKEASTIHLGMTRERATTRLAFPVSRTEIRRRVLIPKYYDPELESAINSIQKDSEKPWISLSEMEGAGLLEINTGVEVGKMSYGTGSVPFIRTSDITDLEIKHSTRHLVNETVYKHFEDKAAVRAGDIVLVRDGTYLVGSSALVGSGDSPALICGGLFRLRINDDSIHPVGLLAALNHQLVRRQMRSKQFTRDVIDTLGDRLGEVKIPHPLSADWIEAESVLKKAFDLKQTIKDRVKTTVSIIEPPPPKILSGRPSWSMR